MSFQNIFNKPVYATIQRGNTIRNLKPRGAGNIGIPPGMSAQSNTTVIGDQIIAKGGIRKFMEFQNNSLIANMVLQYGAVATAVVGDIIVPGGSIRFEIEVPSEDVHMFCGNAGEPYTYQERLAV
jgi:hypothetical protein